MYPKQEQDKWCFRVFFVILILIIVIGNCVKLLEGS